MPRLGWNRNSERHRGILEGSPQGRCSGRLWTHATRWDVVRLALDPGASELISPPQPGQPRTHGYGEKELRKLSQGSPALQARRRPETEALMELVA